MATKIERELSPVELAEFLAKAAALKGALLKDIQALAAEHGISISLMAARNFRNGRFAEYLDDLRAKSSMAESIAAVAKSGLGIADASASILNQKIFDRLMSAGELTDEEADQLSLALQRLRSGDQRARLLEAQLRDYERKEAERAEKKAALQAKLAAATTNKGGVSQETLKQIEEAIGLL